MKTFCQVSDTEKAIDIDVSNDQVYGYSYDVHQDVTQTIEDNHDNTNDNENDSSRDNDKTILLKIT